MERMLLVGAGGLGRVVLEHASRRYECSFLDDANIVSVDGVPVVGTTADIETLHGDYHYLLVSIGDNALRERLYGRARAVGYKLPSVVASSAYLSPHATVGDGCIILNNVVVQNGASVGDGCILNPGVEAHHDSTIGDYCLIYTNSVVRSLANVGDRVWIGSNATVSTGAAVPDDAVVGDGVVMGE